MTLGPRHDDATKLMRAVEDALTGILWSDDSIIAQQVVEKVYGDRPGAEIFVEPIDTGEASKRERVEQPLLIASE